MLGMLLLGLGCMYSFLYPGFWFVILRGDCFTNEIPFCRILFAVIYWYIWTVLLPRWGGYSLEEAVEVLDDGTSITQLVRVYKKDNLT